MRTLQLALVVGSISAFGLVPARLSAFPHTGPGGAPTAVPAQVERWQRGAVAAQSLTFDDSYRSQIKTLIPMLDARGLRGTFFLVSEWVDLMVWRSSWDDWATVLKEKGHEMASHSARHQENRDLAGNVQGLTGLNAVDLAYELEHSKTQIRTQLGLPDGLVFAYPYSMLNPTVRTATANHYIAARAVSGMTVSATPADFYAIGSYAWEQTHTWQDMIVATNTALARGEWAVDMIHGCDGEGWSPPASADYALYFDHIKAQSDLGVLWVAPFGEVVRYIKERDAATADVTVDGQGVHTVAVTSAQPLPPTPVRLTISFPAPATWTTIQATDEGGQPVPASLVQRNGLPYALVDVLPEAPGEVAEVTVSGS